MYERDVWEISFDRETRILTKIIKLQQLTLISLSWILSDFSQIRLSRVKNA